MLEDFVGHDHFYYIPINDLHTIQANEYNKPDGQFRFMLPPCVTD